MSAFFKQDPMTGAWRPTIVGRFAMLLLVLFFGGGCYFITEIICSVLENVADCDADHKEVLALSIGMLAISVGLFFRERSEDKSLAYILAISGLIGMIGFVFYTLIFG